MRSPLSYNYSAIAYNCTRSLVRRGFHGARHYRRKLLPHWGAAGAVTLLMLVPLGVVLGLFAVLKKIRGPEWEPF